MKNTILITGANGFIGQHLVNYLSSKDCLVLAMVREGNVPGFELNKNVNVVYGDLTDKNSLENCIPEGGVVVNLAANPYDPKLSYEVNVLGTKKLIEVCEKKGVIKFIEISSQATKIKDKGVYAHTKSESDELVKSSKINWIILKPSLVYGEGEKGLFNKIKLLAQMLPFLPVFGSGDTKVNPLHVDDLCHAIKSVIDDPKNGKSVYDVGCPTPVTYNELYAGILKNINRKNMIIHVPVFIGLMSGKLFELLKMKSPPFFVDNVLGSTQETNCDSEKISKKYGITLREFDKGLKDVFGSKKIRVGVVGLGKMGLLHLSVLSVIKEVDIVALVDTNKQLFSTIKSMGVSGDYFDNIDEAIKQKQLDAIFILTPTFTHKKLLMKAAKKGINVFVEKPMALNRDEIDRLGKDLKKYKVKIGVGYTLLFKRTIKRIKEIIESKKYGEVIGFEASYEHGEVFGEKTGWMFDKNKSGGGVLMNPGPHLFAIINYFFGKPKSVTGNVRSIYSTEIDDEANLELKYTKFNGKMFLSWSVKNQNIPSLSVKVEFEKGGLETDGKKLRINFKGKEIILADKEISSIVQDSFDVNPDANGEAYYVEDRMFMESISDGKVFPSDLKFALETESMIQDVYKMAAKKI